MVSQSTSLAPIFNLGPSQGWLLEALPGSEGSGLQASCGPQTVLGVVPPPPSLVSSPCPEGPRVRLAFSWKRNRTRTGGSRGLGLSARRPTAATSSPLSFHLGSIAAVAPGPLLLPGQPAKPTGCSAGDAPPGPGPRALVVFHSGSWKRELASPSRRRAAEASGKPPTQPGSRGRSHARPECLAPCPSLCPGLALAVPGWAPRQTFGV